MFTEIITLLKKVKTIDEYGDTKITYEKKEVFGRLDRVYFFEALQAMSQGFENQFRFTLSDYYDYQKEEELIFDDEKYRIINTQRKGTSIELNCIKGID